MLIDWVTARLDFEHFERSELDAMRVMSDRILRYNPKTGEKVWESAAWDSIRSDSHQLSMRVGSDALWVQGSPARVIGEGCAVFGAGASSALDICGCVERMASYGFGAMGLKGRGKVEQWKVSRIDVTGNLLLDSVVEVRDALRVLRDIEGGRYRVSQQAGDTVYWSHKSRIRSGKAYAKGPHLEYQKKRGQGLEYNDEQIGMASRLLRLELKLGSQFLREDRAGKHWYELTAEDLRQQWENYFEKMVGDVEITNDEDLKKRISEVAQSPGYARAAWGTWCSIQTQGWERARAMTGHKTTWYKHIRILREAGLGDADISKGEVVQLRRRVLEFQLVDSWADFRKVA